MAEYISREALLEHLNKCKEDPLFNADMARICFAISIFIENMKAADVQPVKRGKWIENAGYGGWGDTIYQCSECGSEWTYETGISIDWNFCPNCGADMRNE